MLYFMLYLAQRSHLSGVPTPISKSLWIITFPFSRGPPDAISPPPLPPLKPHPSLLKCISIQGLYSNKDIQGSLILKISSLDMPPSQIYCHTFCSPKIINVPLSYYLCLTGFISLCCLSINKLSRSQNRIYLLLFFNLLFSCTSDHLPLGFYHWPGFSHSSVTSSFVFGWFKFFLPNHPPTSLFLKF